MSLYREVAMALSYGRNSRYLLPEQIAELGQVENLIAGAENYAELVNSIRFWAKVATSRPAEPVA